MVNEEYLETNQEDEDENLLEDIGYSKKSDFNKATIVQAAFEKVKEMRAREMKEGYWNVITKLDGSTKKQYVDDTRKAYAGSVDHVKNLLSHEIKTEKTIQESIKEFELMKKGLFDKYAVPDWIITQNKIVYTGEKYIPKIDEEIPVEIVTNNSGGASKISIGMRRGVYNRNFNRYWDGMVLVYDYLFSELNMLVALKEYFKPKPSY